MEKAKSAVFRSCGDRCGNGCCASPLTPSVSSTSLKDLIGGTESNSFTEIGAAEARGGKRNQNRQSRRAHSCFYHATGHVVWRDLHGARSRAFAGRSNRDRRTM